jgi:fructose-bisphosphate aldolase, class II
MLLNTLQTKRLYRYACRNKVGIIAVNADGDSLMHDALLAAKEAQAPLIIEASLWQLEAKTFGYGDPYLGLAKYITDVAMMAGHQAFKDVPVVFHIDHIPAKKAVEILTKAVSGLAYRVWDREMVVYPSSISFDASGLSDADNIQCVVNVGRHAAGHGIPLSFEVEPGIEEESTTPAEAVAMIKAIEAAVPGIVDLFAPAVGTVHGQTVKGANVGFDVGIVSDVAKALENALGRSIGIALHGSSGMSDEQLALAVKHGVIKINTCTLLLGTRARAMCEYFNQHHEQIQEGHKAMKETTKDATVDTAVSQSMVPLLVDRMRVSNAAGHGKKALEYILSGES